jgi:hypothetical protein
MDCVIRDVMPTIKSLGITFRYTINGALHELDSRLLGEEELPWILLYAGDIALLSDDPKKLRDMVTALDLAFRRGGLLINVGKTKTMTVHVPMPGQGLVSVPEIFIDNQHVEHVRQCGYSGQIIASEGLIVKREVSRRLALGYAAFNRLGKQGIWEDRSISRRTKLTLYQVIVRTVLL